MLVWFSPFAFPDISGPGPPLAAVAPGAPALGTKLPTITLPRLPMPAKLLLLSTMLGPPALPEDWGRRMWCYKIVSNQA